MAKNTKIDYYKELLNDQPFPITTDNLSRIESLIGEYEKTNPKGKAAVMQQLMQIVSESEANGQNVEVEPALGPAPKTFSEEFPILTDPEERKKIANAFEAAKPNGTLSEEQKANIKNFGTGGESPARINGKIATDEEVEYLAKENLQTSQLFDAVRDAVAEAMEKAKGYINVPGALYSLPMYQVAQEIGLQPIEGAIQFLPFVKGASDNLKTPQQHGIIMEDLYPVLILHLEELDKVVPSDETKNQIEHLRFAFIYCMKRIVERKLRKVWGTMQK